MPLPSAHRAYGVREKLATYALAIDHPDGGPKARGFAVILGITEAHLNDLAEQLENRLTTAPVTAVRHNPPYGYLCEVLIPIRGVDRYRTRHRTVVTSWELRVSGGRPRLVTIYIKD